MSRLPLSVWACFGVLVFGLNKRFLDVEERRLRPVEAGGSVILGEFTKSILPLCTFLYEQFHHDLFRILAIN